MPIKPEKPETKKVDKGGKYLYIKPNKTQHKNIYINYYKILQ